MREHQGAGHKQNFEGMLVMTNSVGQKQKNVMTAEQEAERQRIALAATWEVDSLVRHLNATLPDAEECMHVRAFAVRIRQLNSVVMSVLDCDHGRSTQQMDDIVEGVAV